MSQITSYSWDEENRMVGVLNADGSSESFTYSGDGQRRSKSRYTPQSTLSDLINYVWDGENILQEVDGSSGEIKAHYTDSPGYWGNLTSVRTQARTPVASGSQFNAAAFGTAGFNQAGTTSSNEEAQNSFYLFDQQSSTRVLVDEDANVSDEYIYRAFGEEVESTGSTRNPHRFQGEVGPYTEADDQVWMRARQYDPITGVWFSVDPIGFDGGDWNLYRFVTNDPISLYDPEGEAVPLALAACVPFIACAGALAAACADCGTNATCWGNCLTGTINHLPTWAKWACGGAAAACTCAILKSRAKNLPKLPKSRPKRPQLQCVFKGVRPNYERKSVCVHCWYVCKGGGGLGHTLRFQYPSCIQGTIPWVPGTHSMETCEAAVKAGKDLWQIFNQ